MKEDIKLKLDKSGIERFKAAIKKKEEELRKIQLYKGTDAIYQGDNWHDNPTLYQTELKEVALISEIARMKQELENAEIVENLNNETLIDIGDTVKIDIILPSGEPQEKTLTLVARDPDMIAGEISINSPIGNALYQHGIGETVSYSVGERKFNVVIKSKVTNENGTGSQENNITKTRIK